MGLPGWDEWVWRDWVSKLMLSERRDVCAGSGYRAGACRLLSCGSDMCGCGQAVYRREYGVWIGCGRGLLYSGVCVSGGGL